MSCWGGLPGGRILLFRGLQQTGAMFTVAADSGLLACSVLRPAAQRTSGSQLWRGSVRAALRHAGHSRAQLPAR